MSIKKEVYDFSELIADSDISTVGQEIVIAVYKLIENGYRIPYRESLMKTARKKTTEILDKYDSYIK